MSQEVTFGTWLRQRRIQLGITQDELSERLGFSPVMLRKLEAGERRPSGQIAHLMADYFRVPSDEHDAFVAFARTGKMASALPPSNGAAMATPSASATSPWRRAYVQRTNLPSMLTPLVGREREIEAVRDLILHPRTRLLTLTGAPGIGKTRLGLQVASDLVEHFEDGAYVVDLTPIVEPGLVPAAIAHALHVKENAGRTIEDALKERVHDLRMLLLLDNFEQVLDAAPFIVRLLQASPWLKILVTSREPLHVRGERRYPLPVLEIPGPRHVEQVEQLAHVSAVRLFVERAQSIDPDFMLNESNASSVAQICRRLGGLPLSIELIAARIRLFSPQSLLARLEQVGDLQLLTGGAQDLPARHRSLRGAIAWSYDLLSQNERALFRRLGVFVGGFTEEAAAYICEDIQDQFLDFGEALYSLLDKNLLAMVTEGAGELQLEIRFSMLETIREYALERLSTEGEMEETQRRHALYFLELAERAEPKLKGPDQSSWLARLEREFSNIRVALEWASDCDVETTVGLMFALRRFWFIRSHYAEGGNWLAKVLAMGDALPVATKAKALLMASSFVIRRGDTQLCVSYLEQSVSLAQRTGDKKLLSVVQSQLGYVLLEQGEYAKAKNLFEESLLLERALGDEYGVCWGLTALGETARAEGNIAQARASYQEGLVLATKANNRYNMSHLVGNLGWLAVMEGDYRQARTFATESLGLTQEMEYDLGTVGCLACFATIAAGLGQPYRAAKLSGVVEHLARILDSDMDATDRRIYELYMDSARAQLDDAQFEKARAEGYEMTLEQAITEALEA